MIYNLKPVYYHFHSDFMLGGYIYVVNSSFYRNHYTSRGAPNLSLVRENVLQPDMDKTNKSLDFPYLA